MGRAQVICPRSLRQNREHFGAYQTLVSECLELEPFQHLQASCLIARQLRLSLSGRDHVRDPRAALAGVSFYRSSETGLRQLWA